MASIEVGRQYKPGRRRWPETTQWRCGVRINELVQFIDSPTAQEIHDHGDGSAQFAFVDLAPHLGILGYRFGEAPWSDTPFQAHRMTTAERGVPGVVGEDLLLVCVLVDASTGLVVSMRLSIWSPAFSDAVRRNIDEQLRRPFDDPAAGALLDKVYSRYPRPVDMLQDLSTAATTSDEEW